MLTSLDAGKANAAVPDAEVLAFAASEQRILISHNRRHFLQLHGQRTADHFGLVLCTVDPDFCGQARRSHEAVAASTAMKNEAVRVNRPG